MACVSMSTNTRLQALPLLRNSHAYKKRWTLDEGPDGINGSDVSASPATTSTATPAISTIAGKSNQTTITPGAGGLLDRWDMNDGAAELAQHGIEMVGAGLYLPSPSPGMVDDGGRRRGGGGGDRERNRDMWAEEHQEEVKEGLLFRPLKYLID